MVGRNGKYKSGWPWSFSGFLMAGWAYRLTQQLFLFLCLFCFCLHTQNFGAGVQLLGNTVASFLFLFF